MSVAGSGAGTRPAKPPAEGSENSVRPVLASGRSGSLRQRCSATGYLTSLVCVYDEAVASMWASVASS